MSVCVRMRVFVCVVKVTIVFKCWRPLDSFLATCRRSNFHLFKILMVWGKFYEVPVMIKYLGLYDVTKGSDSSPKSVATGHVVKWRMESWSCVRSWRKWKWLGNVSCSSQDTAWGHFATTMPLSPFPTNRLQLGSLLYKCNWLESQVNVTISTTLSKRCN